MHSGLCVHAEMVSELLCFPFGLPPCHDEHTPSDFYLLDGIPCGENGGAAAACDCPHSGVRQGMTGHIEVELELYRPNVKFNISYFDYCS